MSDEKAQEAIEERDDRSKAPSDNPPAGPHAKKHLTDNSKTPGAGSLPDERDDDVNPGSG